MIRPSYTGRFAPSPSGPLHAGSLLTAVASYLDARASGGRWYVRMEDIDPPREVPGADRLILQTLERHALYWDGEVLYQSTRHVRYKDVLAGLAARNLVYRCSCTRTRLAGLGGHYDGQCRYHPPASDEACAWRIKVSDLPGGEVVSSDVTLVDRIQGTIVSSLQKDGGDFVIHRKDGLFAYQLAVVVDDVDQGITDVVRGSDILASTARQVFLTQILGVEPPCYAHVPVLLGSDGQKLSKQNHAREVDDQQASKNLWVALQQLGQNPPPTLVESLPVDILAWGIAHWSVAAIPQRVAITA